MFIGIVKNKLYLTKKKTKDKYNVWDLILNLGIMCRKYHFDIKPQLKIVQINEYECKSIDKNGEYYEDYQVLSRMGSSHGGEVKYLESLSSGKRFYLLTGDECDMDPPPSKILFDTWRNMEKAKNAGVKCVPEYYEVVLTRSDQAMVDYWLNADGYYGLLVLDCGENMIELILSNEIKSKQEAIETKDNLLNQLKNCNICHPDPRPGNMTRKGSKNYLIDWVPGKFKQFDWSRLDSIFDMPKEKPKSQRNGRRGRTIRLWTDRDTWSDDE